MEFMNRGNRQTPSPGSPVQNVSAANVQSNQSINKKRGSHPLKGLSGAFVALLFSATILVVALVFFLVLSTPRRESSYIDKNRLQAVFLNGGQVYFGRIADLNDKYMYLKDIFYLRVNQVVQPNQEGQQQPDDISLVKLGCELHRPANEMLINREQVVFWENLRDEDGENTVPGAVKKYLEQFPQGQECQAGTGQQTPAGTQPGQSENDEDTGSDDDTPADNPTPTPETPTTPPAAPPTAPNDEPTNSGQ